MAEALLFLWRIFLSFPTHSLFWLANFFHFFQQLTKNTFFGKYFDYMDHSVLHVILSACWTSLTFVVLSRCVTLGKWLHLCVSVPSSVRLLDSNSIYMWQWEECLSFGKSPINVISYCIAPHRIVCCICKAFEEIWCRFLQWSNPEWHKPYGYSKEPKEMGKKQAPS